MHHAVAVSLERIAIRMRKFGIASPSPAVHGKPQMSER
jgi:hypothetical protein